MKSCPKAIATALSTFLLALVLILAVASYWQSPVLQRRHTHWAGTTVSQKTTLLSFYRGRLELKFSDYSMNFDMLSPEKWATVRPDGQQRLLAFKSQFSEFHGWDRLLLTPSTQPLATTAYDSLLGLTWQPLATPQPGTGRILFIPAWMLAILLALPGARWLRRRRRSKTPYARPLAAGTPAIA